MKARRSHKLELQLAIILDARHPRASLTELAQLAVIKTHLLLLSRSTQAQSGHEVHEEEDNAGHAKGVAESSNGVGKLISKLNVVVVQPASWNLAEAVKVGNVITTKSVSK